MATAHELVPKVETQASDFVKLYPEYDGRNVVVAIFDTGVDPGAPGLQRTPDGRPKIIDIVDATVGDVDMTTVVKAKGGKLKVSAQKVWTVNPAWNAVDDNFRVGIKRGYEFYPQPLVTRLKEAHKDDWTKFQRSAINATQCELAEWTRTHDIKALTLADVEVRKDIVARLAILEDSVKSFDDPGPVFDCVAFFDGTHWRAAVDATGTGDFSTAHAIASYRVAQEYATFSDESQLNYALNVYDDGDVLSIVCDAGSHGTHVAGIVAAYHEYDRTNNGVAPGAQIVSVKIGDSRLGATETGVGICRGILAVLEHKCDIVNMSYGEHAARPNYGRPVELIQELVEKHGVMFVASVGNDGPALGSIKSPGGLSSCILGVGAYVSPDMMAAEYSMLERHHQGTAYTWSSRGPAMDGDVGVNVFARGGAITSVPQWTLMKKQLKNGTSMASPNCAGSVALLLSGLKANNTGANPYELRRALENTAIKVPHVESFAQGCGLIQVVPAFEYLQKYAAKDAHVPLYYDVRVTRPGTTANTRGVCLREPTEVFGAPNVEVQVKVCPVFHASAPNPDKLRLDMNIALVTSQSWIAVPPTIALFHDSRVFSALVHLDHLATGKVHFGEILGYDATDRAKGPLFRVPVTVMKPTVLVQPHKTLSPTVAPGAIFRSFFIVPAGATWVDVRVTSGKQLQTLGRNRTVVLHLMQYETHTRPSATSFHKRFQLDASDAAYSMSVRALSTIEVCVAPMWNTGSDPVLLEVDVVFRGIVPHQTSIVVQGGEGVTRVNLTAMLAQENILPQAKLCTWTQRHRPTENAITPCSSRSTWPDSRVVYQLVVTYKLTKSEDGKAVLRLPILNGRLYDAPFESQLVLVFDANKKLLAASDAVPKEVVLPKGPLIVRVQVRHEDYTLLDKLANMVLFADFTVKDIVVPVYDTPDAASLGSKPMGSFVLERGLQVPVYVGEPDKLPKGVGPGDLLSGRITFGKRGGTNWKGSACKPDGFTLTYVVPPAEAKRKEPDVAPTTTTDDLEEDALREFILTRVNKAIGKVTFDALWENAIATYPNSIALWKAKLAHLDNEKNRLQHLQEIVEAATTLETLMAPWLPTMTAFYGVRQLPGHSSVKTKMDKDKATIVDTWARKARALGDLKYAVEFEKTFGLLQQWANVDDPKFLHVGLHENLEKKQFGTALQRLQKFQELDATDRDKIMPPKKVLEKKIEIYAALGWTHMIHHEQTWAAINAPARYTLF
ncbi:hypothetical protein H310_01086 [Aphanomyces invadans]|uniref:Tripeptidyl-peptidase 2 n=1 Tax=Aphanomyces invadans TaxID=157072 RepID=A0A024USB1_9STRA|nr:hypothetical protein H310_01086 [Aphanomyces invadans]ETW08523.1 hypothetical protein H310_01086 [Aphanomyces invadans]|eukprot:XP_008862328.1 hypothetical protein H310_01086 [Aphanomyces invadans]